MKKKRRWLRLLTLLFVLLIVAPLIALWWAVSAKPAYWQVIDGRQEQVRQSAEQFEQAVSTQLTKVRDEQPVWRVELTQDDLNGWLAARLPQWLANRGVDQTLLDQIARTQISIDPGHLELALQLEIAGLTSVVQLRYKPSLGENKKVRLTLEDVHAGVIPVPVAMVFDQVVTPYVPQRQRDQLAGVRQKVEQVELSFPLGDGRWVDVIGLEMEKGKALLTCRTRR